VVQGEGSFPLSAYSEFMPPPRLGRRPYGEEILRSLRRRSFGWHVTEAEEEYELQPGLASLARQILDELVELGQGEPAYRIAGHKRRNLDNNLYWPPELAARAGQLSTNVMSSCCRSVFPERRTTRLACAGHSLAGANKTRARFLEELLLRSRAGAPCGRSTRLPVATAWRSLWRPTGQPIYAPEAGLRILPLQSIRAFPTGTRIPCRRGRVHCCGAKGTRWMASATC